jgi:hypothetical protein
LPSLQPAPPHAPIRPPNPHDPTERACVSEAHGWTFWVTPRNSLEHERQLRRGALRLQLYHHQSNTSILMPTPRSKNHYELWTPRQHCRVCCYRHLAELLFQSGGPYLPCLNFVNHINAMFVHAAMIGVLLPESQ